MKPLILLIFILFYSSTMSANPRELISAQLEIPGAKIAKQSEAKKIAFDSYVKKVHLNLSATEGVHNISIITLGYDIPNFAIKGDKIWEARISTLESQLRGIIWIHSGTGEVLYITGSWIEKIR